jgi:hypothetical protein
MNSPLLVLAALWRHQQPEPAVVGVSRSLASPNNQNPAVIGVSRSLASTTTRTPPSRSLASPTTAGNNIENYYDIFSDTKLISLFFLSIFKN